MASALTNVPAHLLIKVIYSDDDIIVIDKPCNLRSVPGHATPGSGLKIDDNGEDEDSVRGVAEVKPQRLTAQEAWVQAIRSFAFQDGEKIYPVKNDDDNRGEIVHELIRNLSVTSDTSSIPRKCPTFERYCHRNRRRLLPSFPELDIMSSEIYSSTQQLRAKRQKLSKSCNIPTELRNIAQISFSLIQQRQRPLMNLPTPTDDTESAIGQLHLMGFGDYAHNNHSPLETVDDVKKRLSISDEIAKLKTARLYVVHRLDCQTSGIMVVGRNASAASALCEQWRERNSVKKTYLAFVKRWPPYHEQKLLEGRIDLPLAASRTERIKWEVRPIQDGGKASLTIWKVHESNFRFDKYESGSNTCSNNNHSFGLTLDLQPMTGRTHQLRIHCATVGSGIEGDSLYGDDPIKWIGDQHTGTTYDTGAASSNKTLRLHAHKLSFIHPKSEKEVHFESPKPW